MNTYITHVACSAAYPLDKERGALEDRILAPSSRSLMAIHMEQRLGFLMDMVFMAFD